MSAGLNVAVGIIVDRISALMGQDLEFRSALACILDGLLVTEIGLDADLAKAEEVSLSAAPAEQPKLPDSTPTTAVQEVAVVMIRQLPREPIQTDLSAIESRCRLKAQGACWAAERQRQIQQGMPFSTAIEPRDREIIERAKRSNCFLWMNCRNPPRPDDLGLFDVLASCFETVAEAAALLRECTLNMKAEGLFRQCLDVAAEAQSALRSAVMAVGASNDTEQQSLYEWLKRKAAEKRVYIERHLRSDDPADPCDWAGIQSRIQAIREACREVLDRDRPSRGKVTRRWQMLCG